MLPSRNAESNRYEPEIADLAADLRSDSALATAAAELRFDFRTRTEALVHGDLHTGPEDARVIDPEFTFFGPVGLDPGMLLANLAMSRVAHDMSGAGAFAVTIDRMAVEFWQASVEETQRRWSSSEPWLERFIRRVLFDAARFAGIEMIRRTVGLAHVRDIDSLPPAAT